jgi:Holliday junction DNA helicase RuvA
VGKRTADRIIVELREKIADALDEAALAAAAAGENEPRILAREGLVNLGYSPAEAERLLGEVEGETAEELIGEGLRRAAEATAAREAA